MEAEAVAPTANVWTPKEEVAPEVGQLREAYHSGNGASFAVRVTAVGATVRVVTLPMKYTYEEKDALLARSTRVIDHEALARDGPVTKYLMRQSKDHGWSAKDGYRRVGLGDVIAPDHVFEHTSYF
jgi:hypothetical protein